MKNNLFGKATALVMSSLMIFSDQVLAFSSNNQELDNADALSNYEILIAQNGELSQEEYRTISQVAVEAYSVLLDLQVRLESISESDLPGKDTLIQLVNELLSTIGALQVKANNKSLTKGEGIALAQQIVDLSTTLGDKCANLETTARSEEGKAVARSCVVTILKPQSILGNFDLVKELDDQSTALYSRVNL